MTDSITIEFKSKVPTEELVRWIGTFTYTDKMRWEAEVRKLHRFPQIWNDADLAKSLNVSSYVMTERFGAYMLELVYFKDKTTWRNPNIQ